MTKVFLLLELLGTVAFAASGALTAIEKRFDYFGVLVLAMTTAFGGGCLRDIFLGRTPPWVFTAPLYVLSAFLTATAVFLIVFFIGTRYTVHAERFNRINNIFDALGLGAFTVAGTRLAMEAGFSENVLFVLFIGMLTGIGGGILRDIFCVTIPGVFRKHIYAVASLAGAGLYYVAVTFPAFSDTVSAIIGCTAVFVIRVLATVFRLNFPKAIK